MHLFPKIIMEIKGDKEEFSVPHVTAELGIEYYLMSAEVKNT